MASGIWGSADAVPASGAAVTLGVISRERLVNTFTVVGICSASAACVTVRTEAGLAAASVLRGFAVSVSVFTGFVIA